MEAFFLYIRNITYYLMFAALVGMIVPGDKYKKFVSLVMGFILLAMMLAPLDDVLRFAGGGSTPNFAASFARFTNPVEMPDYQARHDAYIMEAFQRQLDSQLQGHLQSAGFTVYAGQVDFCLDTGQVRGVSATVSKAPPRQSFIRIQPIEISRSMGETSPEGEPHSAQIEADAKKLISQFYNLANEHIYIIVRR